MSRHARYKLVSITAGASYVELFVGERDEPPIAQVYNAAIGRRIARLLNADERVRAAKKRVRDAIGREAGKKVRP